MTTDEHPSTVKARIRSAFLRVTRISARKAVIYLLTHVVIPVGLAYLAAHFAIKQHTRTQYETEAQFVNQLTLAAKFEAEENANDVHRWRRSLLDAIQPIEDFVNERKSSRPDINPGYARLRTSALGELVQSPIAFRHMRPCVISTLSQVHIRLTEANRIQANTDAALVEYNATLPQPLRESYSAAARLQAHIEQLLKVYEGLPVRLHLIADHDPWPCIVNYESEKTGHGETTID